MNKLHIARALFNEPIKSGQLVIKDGGPQPLKYRDGEAHYIDVYINAATTWSPEPADYKQFHLWTADVAEMQPAEIAQRIAIMLVDGLARAHQQEAASRADRMTEYQKNRSRNV